MWLWLSAFFNHWQFSVIRSLLDDPQFHDSCKSVVTASVPYYQQFTASRPATEIQECPADPEAIQVDTDVADVECLIQESEGSIQGEGTILEGEGKADDEIAERSKSAKVGKYYY